MATTSEIGVLLMDKASGAQIGFIKFDSSGMLIYQASKSGMHIFAFKPIDRLLKEQWNREPLYKKHASALSENKKLPDEILEQEANHCANILNSLESPLMLGAYHVTAQVVSNHS
jgi:hypothetical protein